MKYLLLFTLSVCTLFSAKAQNVNELPAGKYEAKFKSAQSRWDRGDIIILNDTQYQLGTNGEAGTYRFSVAAQRIFFTSGPLKSAFTKVVSASGKPVIVLPMAENSSLGLTAEVWASMQ